MIYLYYKEHNVTGLKYLGKTISPDPHKYVGSGKVWRRHINKHGYDVSTHILLATENKDEIRETGLYFSNLWNICKSKEWANIVKEEGSGGDTFSNNPNKDKIRAKLSLANRGKKRTAETCLKISKALSMSDRSYSGMDTKDNSTFKGKNHNENSIEKIKASNRKKNPSKPRKYSNPKDTKIIFTEEHRKNISKSAMGKTPGNAKIIVVGDKEFIGLQRAADYLQIPVSTLRNRIRSKNIHYSHIFIKGYANEY
jgi:hypothetical protein